MKIALLLVSLSLGVCSCQPDSGSDADRPLLSTEDTRRVAMHVLLNRYPKAEIVSETSEGQFCRYGFSTNGAVVPAVVVVDRKAGKARFEKARR